MAQYRQRPAYGDWSYQPEVIPAQGQAPTNSTQLPGPPTNSPELPWDATYASNVSELGLGLNNALASIENQRPGIQRDFGYLQSGDMDPSNPFGKAQLLKQSYDRSRKGLTNQYAARGQLYAGALQNAQNAAQFDYQANDANLRGSYGQQLAALEAQKAQAQGAYSDRLRQEKWTATQTALADRNAPPVDVGYGDSPQYGPPSGARLQGTGSGIPVPGSPAYQQAWIKAWMAANPGKSFPGGS